MDTELHVWPLHLTALNARVSEFSELLSSDEAERAARFKFDRNRHCYIISRGVLRTLLGQYLRHDPSAIRFAYGARGKPCLEGDNSLGFNVSHSGDMALIAFTPGCEIGADIEIARPVKEMDDIAKRFFSPEECQQLMSLPAIKRERAFFHCWTRKESYIKAIGEGLFTPLDEFQVSLLPDHPPRMVHISQDSSEAAAWTIHSLDVHPDYAAAVAYRAPPRKVFIKDFGN